MENTNDKQELEQEILADDCEICSEEEELTQEEVLEEDEELDFDTLAFGEKPVKAKKVEKPVKEKKPVAAASNKNAALPLWASICIAVLATAVVTLAVLLFIDRYNNPPVPTEPTVNFDSYTGEEKELISIRDRVVATAGDKELTSAKLQVYYWITVYSFLDENSYYLSLMGFDYTKDFATQECYFEKGISWQEYFLKNTLSTWHQYAALSLEAQKNDFKLNEEEQKYLDGFRETMDAQAKLYGYADAQEMIAEELGVGSTFDAYVEYTKETFIGMGYYNQFAEGLEITEEDILCYYQDNKATFEENKITKDDTDFAWVGVRHILLIPEATKDENGKEIYTDDAWEACRKEAQALLDSFLAGKDVTEEAFAELAKKHTEDPGSKENGGLYDQFFRNEMVAEFENWSFDATRKYGDVGLIKTSYGYHLMYFIEGEAQWHYYADAELRSEECKKFLEGLEAEYPLTVDYDKILIGHVDLG